MAEYQTGTGLRGTYPFEFDNREPNLVSIICTICDFAYTLPIDEYISDPPTKCISCGEHNIQAEWLLYEEIPAKPTRWLEGELSDKYRMIPMEGSYDEYGIFTVIPASFVDLPVIKKALIDQYVVKPIHAKTIWEIKHNLTRNYNPHIVNPSGNVWFPDAHSIDDYIVLNIAPIRYKESDIDPVGAFTGTWNLKGVNSVEDLSIHGTVIENNDSKLVIEFDEPRFGEYWLNTFSYMDRNIKTIALDQSQIDRLGILNSASLVTKSQLMDGNDFIMERPKYDWQRAAIHRRVIQDYI